MVAGAGFEGLAGDSASLDAWGETAGPASRAAAMASLAAFRLPNGPRMSGSPSSSICSASTTTHVPDCGSMEKRVSRVSQRPPPSRLSEPSSGLALAIPSRYPTAQSVLTVTPSRRSHAFCVPVTMCASAAPAINQTVGTQPSASPMPAAMSTIVATSGRAKRKRS